MAWLIVYGILSLLTFVVLTISTVVGIKEANSIFKFPIYRVQDCLFRLILLSIFFPFTWIALIIQIFVDR